VHLRVENLIAAEPLFLGAVESDVGSRSTSLGFSYIAWLEVTPIDTDVTTSLTPSRNGLRSSF
jgi:hypothetical protein